MSAPPHNHQDQARDLCETSWFDRGEDVARHQRPLGPQVRQPVKSLLTIRRQKPSPTSLSEVCAMTSRLRLATFPRSRLPEQIALRGTRRHM